MIAHRQDSNQHLPAYQQESSLLDDDERIKNGRVPRTTPGSGEKKRKAVDPAQTCYFQNPGNQSCRAFHSICKAFARRFAFRMVTDQ